MSEMFVNEAARESMVAWCERFRAKSSRPTESRRIPTSFGETHVLVAGPESEKPPLVVLHAMMASSAHTLSELGALPDQRRVYAVDVLGQSPWSEDKRLDLKDGSYARWTAEVLDKLGLGRVAMLGVSWGGFVALRTAIEQPERVARLALLVPAGVVKNGFWAGLRDAGWAFMTYKLLPNEARRDRFLRTLFTTMDDDWGRFIDEALRAYKPDMRIPPLATDEELARVRCPVLAFGAELDASFPGAALLARIKGGVPHAELELIEGARHCPPFTDAFRAHLAERVGTFLDA